MAKLRKYLIGRKCKIVCTFTLSEKTWILLQAIHLIRAVSNGMHYCIVKLESISYQIPTEFNMHKKCSNIVTVHNNIHLNLF